MSALHPFVLRTFTALAFYMAGHFAVHAQTVASDNCEETATNQWTFDHCDTLHMWDAFGVDGSVPNSCGTPTNDAFVWFIGTGDSTNVGIAPNNGADPAVVVYTGNCASLTQVVCQNVYPQGGLVEEATFLSVSGIHYLVRIQTMGDIDSIPYGRFCVETTPLPPANGSPCSATFLPVTADCSTAIAATNYSSLTTVGISDPCRTDASSGDVWFRTVVPSTGHLIIDTQCLNAMDGAMSLYTTTGGCADVGATDWLECVDQGSSTGNDMPQFDIPTGTLILNDTVYIRFWAYDHGEDNFRICASYGTTTLPVDFIAFQAQAHNGVVDITWSTATEQNSDHFVVERSTDNTDFQGIGELPAAGESSNQHDYSYTDMAPPSGTVYYRVREVDHDGSSMTTNTVVAFPTEASDAPLLYPNPALDQVHVAFTAEQDGNAQITVIDAVGRVLLQQTLTGQHGRRTANVDLHELVPGYYAVRITQPSGEVLRAGGFIKR